jgi:hypothetical protein
MDEEGISLMDSSISDYHHRCLTEFQRVLSSLSEPNHLFQHDISFTDVSNEFDRYKLWSSSVGAPHNGPRYRISLDYRLREAPSHKKLVGDILDRLVETVSCPSFSLSFNHDPHDLGLG